MFPDYEKLAEKPIVNFCSEIDIFHKVSLKLILGHKMNKRPVRIRLHKF